MIPVVRVCPITLPVANGVETAQEIYAIHEGSTRQMHAEWPCRSVCLQHLHGGLHHLIRPHAILGAEIEIPEFSNVMP